MLQREGGGSQKKCKGSASRTRPESGILTSACVPLVGTSSYAKLLMQCGGEGSSRWAAVYPAKTLVDKEYGEN